VAGALGYRRGVPPSFVNGAKFGSAKFKTRRPDLVAAPKRLLRAAPLATKGSDLASAEVTLPMIVNRR
jgi:hypothetical protein